MSKKNNVFSDLELAIKQAEEDVKNKTVLSREELLVADKRLRALTEIKKYVDSYSWCKGSKTADRVDEIRKANFDYELLKSKGYSYDAIKSFVYRVSKMLEEKIGEDTLSLIVSSKDSESDKVGIAMAGFRVLSGKIDFQSLMLNGIFEYLPKGEKLEKIYNIAECENELTFLYSYSKISSQLLLEDLDMDKLNTLVYIMTHKTERYGKFQNVAIQLFKGKNFDYDTVMRMIENNEFD